MILSVILLSMVMILLFILRVIRHLVCGNNLKWLLNLDLIYETLDWGKKWLTDFNAGKTQLVSFDGSNNNWFYWCENGWVLEEKSSFEMLGWGPYIISIAKTASNKIGSLICSMKFFVLRLLCFSVNLPYAHV